MEPATSIETSLTILSNAQYTFSVQRKPHMASCRISDNRRIYGGLFRTDMAVHLGEKSVTIYRIHCRVLKIGSQSTFSN